MKRAFLLGFALLSLLVASAPLRAEPPANRDELLRLVPDDYGFCLVIQDLKGHVEKWQQSAFVNKLAGSPLFKALLDDPGLQALAKGKRDLAKLLGLSEQKLLDDVLSEQIVLAYRPAAKMENEEGLLLLRARKKETLAKLIDQINTLQKNARELKELETREHQGVKYVRRADERQTLYYLLDGPFLAVSEKEAVVRAVIEQTRGRPQGESSLVARQFTRAGADRALAALWINPRAFDADLKAKAQKQAGVEAAFLQSFQSFWQALDGIVISCNVEEELQLRLTLQARVDALPIPLRPAFAEPTKVSKLWEYFPDTALAAAAGRFDFAGLSAGQGQFADLIQRTLGDALEFDVFKDLLPALGPDWGVCVLPPEGDSLVPRGLAALRVEGGSKNVDRSLYNALQFGARLGVMEFNRTHTDRLQLTTVKQGDVEVKVITGDKALPAGFQPAFALKDGYLVLATAASAIQQFKAGAGKAPTGRDVPLLRVSCVNIAKVLRERRDPLIAHLAEKNAINKTEAAHKLDMVFAVIELFDHVAITQQSGEGQLAWTLRLRAAKVD